MKKTQHSALPKAVSSVEGSTRHSPRRGSILILVIALLVMLALIGTAFISTTRIDRTAAAQNSANTQIDMADSSVANIATNWIVNSLFDTSGNYRGPVSIPNAVGAPAAAPYEHADSPVNDLFLASRAPASATTWEWISAPPPGLAFEDPQTGMAWFPHPDDATVRASPALRYNVGITTVTIGNNKYPALQPTSPAAIHIAADADGDGIPDSGLFRIGSLPGPQNQGITYYGAIRIIDGNSAVNASTAWQYSNDTDSTGTAVRNNRLNPAAIGLQELVSTHGDSATTVNGYRAPNGINIANFTPYGDYSISNPTKDSPTLRSDFTFQTSQEVFWSLLGSRLDFPGYDLASGFGTTVRFRAFPVSETALLAHRAGLLGSSKGLLENSLPASTASSSVPTKPYDPATQLLAWYAMFYNSAGPTTLRQLIVAHNPVSEAAPVHQLGTSTSLSRYPATTDGVAPWSSTRTYKVGDVVTDINTSSTPQLSRVYQCILASVGNQPSVSTGNWAQLNTYLGQYATIKANLGSTPSFLAGDVVTDLDSVTATVEPNTYIALSSNSTEPYLGVSGVSPTWAIIPFSQYPIKANVNTASFSQMWLAYWNVMVGSIDATGTAVSPFGPSTLTAADIFKGNKFAGSYPFTDVAGVSHEDRMFRSPFRDSTVTNFFKPDQVMLLRSALAAVNAEALRDNTIKASSAGTIVSNGDDVKFERINLNLSPVGTVNVDVYGIKKQLFLIEVFAQTDKTPRPSTDPPGIANQTNQNGYIALKFYNPYPVPISLADWQLATTTRTAATRTYMPLIDFNTVPSVGAGGATTPAIVPANGYLLIENFTGSGAGALYRPPSSNLNVNGDVSVAGKMVVIDTAALTDTIFGQELVLFRPRRGSTSTGTLVCFKSSGTNYDETANIADNIPCDSFDFTGFAPGTYVPANIAANTPASATANDYHYIRANDEWHFVYPGRYDGSAGVHQQGITASLTWNPIGNPTGTPPVDPDPDPFTTTPPVPTINLAGTTGATDSSYEMANASAASTPQVLDRFNIQLANAGFGGPNPMNTSPYKMPFGNFMTEGQLLQIPFIGAYKISTGAGAGIIYDANPVTMDSAFAEDTDQADNNEENIGRFTPIATPSVSGFASTVADFATVNGVFVDSTNLRYGWAGRLFDYLTVTNAHSQHLPDVDPNRIPTGAASPQPVALTPGGFAQSPIDLAKEVQASKDGLININTAPLNVLAAVPWVNADVPVANRAAVNQAIAQQIITYRQGTAGTPAYFHNLFELNKVTGFRTRENYSPATAWGAEASSPAFGVGKFVNKTNDNGDFSPPAITGSGATAVWNSNANSAATDLVNNDFELQYQMLTGVSNLVTTRSDTFTVYIDIEGWTGVGTATPTRVNQRRIAFLVDRTGVTSTNNRVVKITPVPTD